MYWHEVILVGKFYLSFIYNCNNLPKVRFLRVLKYFWKVVGKGGDMFCACQTSLTIAKLSMLSMCEILKIVALKCLWMFFPLI